MKTREKYFLAKEVKEENKSQWVQTKKSATKDLEIIVIPDGEKEVSVGDVVRTRSTSGFYSGEEDGSIFIHASEILAIL